MPQVSIIIRTKNEEKWIGHCLKMIEAQSFKDHEVILVDNDSTDHTVQIARRHRLAKVVSVGQFKPGHAINLGIENSSGKYLVCLSAHCVPENEHWLANLLRNFDDTAVAGVYGRQLPLAFSEASDKRDLLITFGLDRRVQVKDYFFHNANSMFRRDIWEKIPFDAQATNIEDRIWGKAVIEAGYKIVYEPEAAVYHHHGIHQDNNQARAQSVVSVIETFDSGAWKTLPDFLKPENRQIVAVLPVLGAVRRIDGKDLLTPLIERLKVSKFVKKIFVLSEDPEAKSIAQKNGAGFLDRPAELLSKEKTIEDVLKYALEAIEKLGEKPEIVLSANYLHPFRPADLFDELILDLSAKGLDTVFAGYEDYQNFWVRDAAGSFKEIGEGLKTREHKQPLYESLYGLGCASSAHDLRAGKLVGSRIGILPLKDRLFTIKCVDEPSAKLISTILRHSNEVF